MSQANLIAWQPPAEWVSRTIGVDVFGASGGVFFRSEPAVNLGAAQTWYPGRTANGEPEALPLVFQGVPNLLGITRAACLLAEFEHGWRPRDVWGFCAWPVLANKQHPEPRGWRCRLSGEMVPQDKWRAYGPNAHDHQFEVAALLDVAADDAFGLVRCLARVLAARIGGDVVEA